MKTVNQLKQERASLVKHQQTLVDKATDEKRELTDDETKEFRTRQTEIEEFKQKIIDAEAREANERLAAAAAGTTVGESEGREKKKMLKNYSLHKALRSGLQGYILNGIEAEYDKEIRKNIPKGVAIQGIAVPNVASEKRVTGQSVTGDSGNYGGNLVIDDFQGVIENLRANPIVEQLGARYLRGLTGDAVFPTNDGGIVATWETEVATTGITKTAYGKKTMSPNRLSCTVSISLQNILQSTPDLERITVDDIRRATEAAIDIAAVNGSGSGEPEGVLNTTGINVLTGATNGIAPSWAQLVAMETAIYEANANTGGELKYLITPGTRGFLKKTPHTANDAYYLMDLTNMINGYKVGTSTFVPSNLTKGTGSDLHAAIFGDFSQLLIGEWGFFDMVVDNITQKNSGIIEITVNQFLDILVRQPSAFSVSKDFIV